MLYRIKQVQEVQEPLLHLREESVQTDRPLLVHPFTSCITYYSTVVLRSIGDASKSNEPQPSFNKNGSKPPTTTTTSYTTTYSQTKEIRSAGRRGR
jgi:hypothetical protein